MLRSGVLEEEEEEPTYIIDFMMYVVLVDSFILL